LHITDEQVQRAFQEIYRVLRPGGVLLLAYHIGNASIRVDTFLDAQFDLDFMFFDPERIEEFLRLAGFRSVATTEREPHPDVEYASRRACVFAYK